MHEKITDTTIAFLTLASVLVKTVTRAHPTDAPIRAIMSLIMNNVKISREPRDRIHRMATAATDPLSAACPEHKTHTHRILLTVCVGECFVGVCVGV